jgi:hypothetical protein
MGYYDDERSEQPYSNEELINQAQPPAQSPQYDRVIQEEKVANFVSQTSPTKNLDAINKILKGYFFNQQTKQWDKISQGIPEEMRVDYLQFLTPFLSEDVRMGRMDRNSINNIMNLVIEHSIEYLDIEADSYYLDKKSNEYKKKEIKVKTNEQQYTFDVKTESWKKINPLTTEKEELAPSISEEQLSKINYIVCAAVAFVLWRAENGVERDRMYGSLKLGDNFQDYAKQEEKKSLLSSILPWK